MALFSTDAGKEITMDKPRILFLTHRFPYPPNRGDRIRSFRLLEFMSKIAAVDLGTLCDEKPSDEYVSVLKSYCQRTAFVPWRPYGRWIHAGLSLLSGSTMTEGLFSSSALRRQIRVWTEDTTYDRVVVFCSSMYPYSRLPELKNIPLITDIVDVDSQKWFDYAAVSTGVKGLFKRRIFETEGRRLRQKEIEIAQTSLRTLAVSEDEAKLYRSFCPENVQEKIIALSNGVDSDFFSPDAQYAKSDVIPFRLVFVGAMDYRANLDGIEWFLENAWETIKQAFPKMELDLVGSNPGEKARSFAKTPGVNLIGRVDDVRPYIYRANAVVIPLRVARGIQNKTLEAMAMAKPVLASPMSLQGIDNSVTQFAWSCNEPQSWIDSLTQLFNLGVHNPDVDFRALRGRQAIVETYSWSARFAKLSELILTPK